MKEHDVRKVKYGDCVFCGGGVSEVKDKLVYEYHEQIFIFEGVLLGKCGQCGERFLTPNVARKLEKLASSGGHSATTVAVPVLKAM